MVAARLAALGVTGCHDPGELNDDRVMKRGPLFYRDLAAADGLAAASAWLDPGASARSGALELGPRAAANRSVATRCGWLKLFADGSLGSRSAALLEPYLDADTNPPTGGPTGMVVTDAAELAELVAAAAEAGIVGQVHAIGDGAVRMALDVFADLPRGAWSAVMRRIEHAQLVDPADQPRFGALGVAASVQPVHLRSDAEQARVPRGASAPRTPSRCARWSRAAR